MKALDLFCCAGGAGEGLRRAGFQVTGVDIKPQPHYQAGNFIQGNALEADLSLFDFVWASPPCQRFSRMTNGSGSHKNHPDLIELIRAKLGAWGGPYIIENVPGCPLHDPITLCGTMFGLKVYRHRLFESNLELAVPSHPRHQDRMPRAGRGSGPTGFISVVGHIGDVAAAREAMGIGWMNRDELSQAIPPAYSEYLGRQVIGGLLAHP